MAAMTLGEFLVFLLIAGICGAIAQSLVGYSHGGCLVSIALGLIGAARSVDRSLHLLSSRLADDAAPVAATVRDVGRSLST